MVELGRLCGVSEAAVRNWVDHRTWPFSNRPPWNVNEVIRWREESLGKNPAATPGRDPKRRIAGDSLTAAKIAVHVEQAKTYRLKREILEGRYLLKEAVDAENVARITTIKAAFFALARNVAGELITCKTADELADVLHTRMSETFNNFSDTGHNPEPDAAHDLTNPPQIEDA